MLEGFHAVEHKQGALLADQLGQPQAPVARRAGRGLGISEPPQGRINEERSRKAKHCFAMAPALEFFRLGNGEFA